MTIYWYTVLKEQAQISKRTQKFDHEGSCSKEWSHRQRSRQHVQAREGSASELIWDYWVNSSNGHFRFNFVIFWRCVAEQNMCPATYSQSSKYTIGNDHNTSGGAWGRAIFSVTLNQKLYSISLIGVLLIKRGHLQKINIKLTLFSNAGSSITLVQNLCSDFIAAEGLYVVCMGTCVSVDC